MLKVAYLQTCSPEYKTHIQVAIYNIHIQGNYITKLQHTYKQLYYIQHAYKKTMIHTTYTIDNIITEQSK